MNLQRPSTKEKKKTVQTLSQPTQPEYCTPKSTKKKKNSQNPKSTLQAKFLNAQVTN